MTFHDKQAGWATKAIPVSHRAHDLIWSGDGHPDKPTVTVEDYCKWYSLHIVHPSGEIHRVEFPDFGHHEKIGSPFLDHVPNPAHVLAWAITEGYAVDGLAFSVMCDAWVGIFDAAMHWHPDDIDQHAQPFYAGNRSRDWYQLRAQAKMIRFVESARVQRFDHGGGDRCGLLVSGGKLDEDQARRFVEQVARFADGPMKEVKEIQVGHTEPHALTYQQAYNAFREGAQRVLCISSPERKELVTDVIAAGKFFGCICHETIHRPPVCPVHGPHPALDEQES